MPLIDRLQQDIVVAMKSRDEARLSTLRMMKAALMKAKVDSPKPLDEAAEMQILKTEDTKHAGVDDGCGHGQST